MRTMRKFLFTYALFATSAFGQNSVDLNLEPNTHLTLSSESKIKIVYPNKEKENLVENKTIFSNIIFKSNKNGEYIFDQSYDKIKIDKVLKDSNNRDSLLTSDTEGNRNFQGQLIANTLNKTFNVKIDKKHNVVISNHSALFDNLFDKVYKKCDDDMKEIFTQRTKNILNENVCKSEVDEIVSIYTDLIQPDSTWENTFHYYSGINANFNTTYKIVDKTEDKLKIIAKTAISGISDSPVKFEINGNIVLLYDIEGTISGTYILDMKSGMMITGNSNCNISCKEKSQIEKKMRISISRNLNTY